MKKVLVTYARYGSGHMKIAEYIAKYIEENNKNTKVLLLDITPYGTWLGKISVKVMDWVLDKRTELLFDTSYELMNNKLATLNHNRFTKRCYDNEDLRKIITDFNPDVTISTHFYCSNLITYYNKLKYTNSKIYTVITDYTAHEIWIRNKKYEDGYIVADPLVKEDLIRKKVSSKKIFPYGLPLNIEEIKKLDDSEKIIKRYNLDKDKDTYLFFGGSTAGSMYYYDYFKKIVDLHLDKNIIFISGKNKKLQEKCNQYLNRRNSKNIIVLGYSNDVFNLMKISSLVISKPGGATVTECLEMKVPMLLIPGIGGQEKYNARFMVKKKCGIKVRGVHRFEKILKNIENDKKIINKLKDNMLKLDSNKSIEKINELIKRV